MASSGVVPGSRPVWVVRVAGIRAGPYGCGGLSINRQSTRNSGAEIGFGRGRSDLRIAAAGDDRCFGKLAQVALITAIISIPISVAIAILRYRLYDIDLIINRTLVYGALTAVLALIYLVGVVGVGGLVRELTGQEKNNLVVAASTLAVAAAFRPARSRVQAFIDQRFYRKRYDAQQTISDFSSKMRDQIDLDSLTTELAGVVRETVQPTHVSLWLRS
jgi:hypothetical protein